MADWDERYRRGEHASDKPHALLVRASETRSPGRALDVAATDANDRSADEDGKR